MKKRNRKTNKKRKTKTPATSTATSPNSTANVALGNLYLYPLGVMGYDPKTPSRADMIVTVRTLVSLIHP